MSDELLVAVGDRLVGTVRRQVGGRLRFSYDDDYRQDSAATPLSVSMPIQVREHEDAVIAPWLWGLLPDNNAVIDRWARQFHTARTPFALLGTVVGRDCAGAVHFAPSDRADELLSPVGGVVWLTTEQVGERLEQLQADSTAWLGSDFQGQFSLGGAQTKTALLYRAGRWGLPSGSTPTTHILKPAVSGFTDHDLNEHLSLEAARRIGLLGARSRIAVFGTVSAVVIERYDRLTGERGLQRLHQEDLCQALSIHPEQKYQADGGPGPREISTLLRTVMPARAAADALRRFRDALAWNWLIAGTDGHAKNSSLLLAGDQVRLAPLYDVASGLPYADEHKLRLAMKVGHDYRVADYQDPWPTAAKVLGLDTDETRARVIELARAAADAFAQVATGDEVRALKSDLPARLVDLVAARAERCLRLLSA